MKIHIVQHVDFEDGEGIVHWAKLYGHSVIMVRADKGEPLPTPAQTDLVVLLGGTFEIEDESLGWLRDEKLALRLLLAQQKNIFAICGGAQLLTTLMGGQVTQNNQAEIGWFDIQFSETATKLFPKIKLDKSLVKVFHWHREIFSLPPGAQLLASSEATKIQAYQLGKNILAVQFHPEITPRAVDSLIRACGSSVNDSEIYQQSFIEMTKISKSSQKATALLLESLMGFFA